MATWSPVGSSSALVAPNWRHVPKVAGYDQDVRLGRCQRGWYSADNAPVVAFVFDDFADGGWVRPGGRSENVPALPIGHRILPDHLVFCFGYNARAD